MSVSLIIKGLEFYNFNDVKAALNGKVNNQIEKEKKKIEKKIKKKAQDIFGDKLKNLF